jgi:hypothetical protein
MFRGLPQLLRQFLTESFLFTTVAAVFSLFLVDLLIQPFEMFV